ncbi:MAG: T9SS type A sorting domain-containing protein [Bacteroidetes bacterium]|nr:T9SS type A sorting domain-containing protein [Bacteroidota bacterium]
MKNMYPLICLIVLSTSAIQAQYTTDNQIEFSRNTTPNVLHMHVAGGDYGYQDNLYIYFWEGATTGYDVEIEAIKWYSINEDATMIWSIASDDTELAINAMPLSCLYNGMTSIPIHFQCGYDGEYTFTFDGFDNFEYPTEFWLQDLTREDDWLNINNENNSFTIQGYASDANYDRFVMHFMDPTGIESNPFDSNTKDGIKIYSSSNRVFVACKNPENIKGIYIYDLTGNEIQTINSHFNVLNTYDISCQMGYYFIKVVTKNDIYSQKVFIGY